MKIFVRLAAAYFMIIGLASLLAPQASGHTGHTLSAFDIFLVRSLGAALTTIGMMDWLLATKIYQSVRGPLTANVITNVTLATIDIVAAHNKIIGNSAWFGISMHLVLCAGFCFCLFRNYTIKTS